MKSDINLSDVLHHIQGQSLDSGNDSFIRDADIENDKNGRDSERLQVETDALFLEYMACPETLRTALKEVIEKLTAKELLALVNQPITGLYMTSEVEAMAERDAMK